MEVIVKRRCVICVFLVSYANGNLNTNEIIKFSLKNITFSEKEVSISLW